MLNRLLIVCLVVFGLFSFAFAETTTKENMIKGRVQSIFKNFKINKVRKSPIPGLYELVGDNRIIYSDGNHMFVGHVFDFNGNDLTKAKLEKISTSKIDNIDLTAALKIGNGKKKVIEFTDPECPYCLKSEEFFVGKDVTRYVYFVPLPMHKNAVALSEHILCSSDKERVYEEVMSGKYNLNKLNKCSNGAKQLKKMDVVAKSMSVRGTPLFYIDGKRVEGANPVIKSMIN